VNLLAARLADIGVALEIIVLRAKQENRRGSHPNVFVPQLWVLANEFFHHPDAFVALHYFKGNAARAEKLFFANKCPVLADDDARNPIQQNGPAAHGTRRERGIEGTFAVDGGGLAAGIFQRVHFAVQDAAAFLHAPVVPAANDLIAMSDYRSDWDATFRESLPGFLDSGLKKWIHVFTWSRTYH